MKTVVNHLAAVILALAAIACCCGVIAFAAPSFTGSFLLAGLTNEGNDILEDISNPPETPPSPSSGFGLYETGSNWQTLIYSWEELTGSLRILDSTGVARDGKESSLAGDLYISDEITEIKRNSYYDCSELTGVLIPHSVTSIGNHAFGNCTSLTNVVFEEGSQLTTLGQYVFTYCSSLQSITLPDSVTSVGNNVFNACSALEDVNINTETLQTIGVGMFWNCKSLPEIILISGATEIKSNTFTGCYSLINVVIPDGISTIGMQAFFYCKNMTSVTIPATVKTIDNEAFMECPNLEEIIFEGTQEQWDAISKGGNWNAQSGINTATGKPIVTIKG